MSTSTVCPHNQLTFKPCPLAESAGYDRPAFAAGPAKHAKNPADGFYSRLASHTEEPTAAEGRRARKTSTPKIKPEIFPAPLCLPDDALALDPEYPEQSFQEWRRGFESKVWKYRRLNARNGKQRNKIFVVPPPKIDPGVQFLSDWARPRTGHGTGGSHSPLQPETDEVIEYLRAFYSGMEVVEWPSELSFVRWDEDDDGETNRTARPPKRRKKCPPDEGVNVGLASSDSVTRIRTRACSQIEDTARSLFPHQLNLNDLIDTLVDLLPGDAFCICLLVNHDMYEDDDDDFACGRAFGWSHVAVVSTARYNPTIDAVQGVERQHGWPASHCQSYIRLECNGLPSMKEEIVATSRAQLNSKTRPREPTVSRSDATDLERDDPLISAVEAFKSASQTKKVCKQAAARQLSSLWLWRVCRTVSHEIGHCFGLDHCVHFACIMQGTAGLQEDARQPPYLCPIDAMKLITAATSDPQTHHEGLLTVCEKFRKGDGHASWAAFGTWLREVLELARG